MSTPIRRRLLDSHRPELDERSANEVEGALTPAERCGENGHAYEVRAPREYPWVKPGIPIEVVCLRDCGSGPWPVGESAADLAAKLVPGNCSRCGSQHEGTVHCARCGGLYVHPEGRSQRAASAALDVCGPCEKAIDEELGKSRPEAVAE